MAANEDSFKFEYGADFPSALDTLSYAIQGRGMGHSFSPAELLTQLNIAAEYKEKTIRRPGKGKRLEASKFEGEMETESRKNAQAACHRLIIPKAKDEIPDIFLRRLDAHRTAAEALIPPLQPPETNVDFLKRMTAVKANAYPNAIILPKGDQESDAEFESRLNVAKECPGLVLPRGKSETADHFKFRMAQQAKSKQTIMPKGVDESERIFKKRAEIQYVCNFTIHPFDIKRETEEQCFNVRLTAHRELCMIPIEPGDMSVLKKFAAEIKKEATYDVDASQLNAKLEEEKQQLEAAKAEKEEARRQSAAASKQAKSDQAREEDELDEEEAQKEKEEHEKKMQAMLEQQKEAAAAKKKAEEEAANRKQSFDEESISFSTIGFMPLKKLLMERGVPKDAVFSCSNKVALKEVAAKHNCKIVFID
mmetsp:Transcript_39824/g.91516  ORF Transcript_39824/g.91516 Transcript_39824/m.91516 type:complete len:422 (+) Transcript_39824:50-1315(+)